MTRTLTGVIIGATLTILWHILGTRWVAWVLTRNLPATPEGWEPRMRTWVNGAEVPVTRTSGNKASDIPETGGTGDNDDD